MAYKNDITKYVLVGLKDSEGNGNYYIYNEEYAYLPITVTDVFGPKNLIDRNKIK